MWLSIPCRLPQLLRISCLLWNITECDKTTVWHERQFKIHILFFLWIQWPAISICARDVDWKGGQSIRADGLKINATIQYSTAEWAHEEIPQQHKKISQEYFPIALVLSYHWLCWAYLSLVFFSGCIISLHVSDIPHKYRTQEAHLCLLLLKIWSLTNAPLLIDTNIHINGDQVDTPVSSQACHLILLLDEDDCLSAGASCPPRGPLDWRGLSESSVFVYYKFLGRLQRLK